MALLLRLGSRIDLMENVATMAAEMDRFAPGQKAGEGYKRFLALSEHLHGVSEKFFFWKPVQDLFDTIDIAPTSIPAPCARRALAAHARLGRRHIRGKVRDARLAQMLATTRAVCRILA